MWGFFFFLCRQSFVFFLSSCWGWGGLLLSLFWCGCCAFLLGHLRFSAEFPAVAALLGFCTWLTQVGCPTPVVDVFVGLVGSWYSTWFFTLCQRGFPLAGSAPLPLLLLTLRGCSTLSGSSLRVYFCGGALWLGWRGICCVTWFFPMCRALPQGLQLSQLQVTLGFSGDRVSVLLLPW